MSTKMLVMKSDKTATTHITGVKPCHAGLDLSSWFSDIPDGRSFAMILTLAPEGYEIVNHYTMGIDAKPKGCKYYDDSAVPFVWRDSDDNLNWDKRFLYARPIKQEQPAFSDDPSIMASEITAILAILVRELNNAIDRTKAFHSTPPNNPNSTK